MTHTDFSHAVWRKSSRSNSSQVCVEVATTPRVIGVRDSKDRGGPVLAVGRTAWRSFLGGLKGGAFDR